MNTPKPQLVRRAPLVSSARVVVLTANDLLTRRLNGECTVTISCAAEPTVVLVNGDPHVMCYFNLLSDCNRCGLFSLALLRSLPIPTCRAS